ncbi:hypothetical protein N7481_005986 [Penicillium waksmanii]|uniref:uncharacterized protein n=1 Tax=Penicillium waksmanii TaxID=69791 RepID=UPI00254936ED|nr:uncharacterized protein N7481_005986 [Penicillium waksmanii]KAJ5983887.1 hypothetical protein N7481_005986 [Penicillium waksmanii]
MPESPTHNRPPTNVAGGTGTTPTPANNIGGGAGWGDRSFHKGGMNDVPNEGKGHIDPSNPHETMGAFLGLKDQKSRAEAKYLARAGLAGDDIKTTTDSGEPTCSGEDHSFMGTKPGGADTLPGWGTMKNAFGNLKS